jgi:arylsulfatase A-like enzyme
LFWEWRFPNINTYHWAEGAVRKRDWKLLFNDKIKRIELYNIVKDPFEEFNKSEENKQIVINLKQTWMDWKKEFPE